MRSLRAIGYDMDYTLVQYDADAWEKRAFEHLRERLATRGWPMRGLRFDSRSVVRGLIIDRECGNLVKANRFGYVKRAAHGTRLLSEADKKSVYSRLVVDPDSERFASLNTLFSLSEAAMYAQLVHLLDDGHLDDVAGLGYIGLHDLVRTALDEAHMEGRLKAEIMAAPERFVEPDPALAITLLDQREAGLHLTLITNSEWHYTRSMMSYVLDEHLPDGMTWRDLFRLVICLANKPDFFENDNLPAFAMERDAGEGLLSARPAGITEDGVWVGGNAAMVERHFGIDGSQVLYVGDHMYGDVRPSKGIRRWRTALILRELEDELDALEDFSEEQKQLSMLMAEKEELEAAVSALILSAQRDERGYGSAANTTAPAPDSDVASLRERLFELDRRIAPLAASANALVNREWGPIMRTGMDKSALARHIEQHADLYTARVSNFLDATPFAFFRAPYGSLPHDPGLLVQVIAPR